MNIITVLKDEHDKLDQVLQKFQQGGSVNRFSYLLEHLTNKWDNYIRVEEQVLYPALQKYPELMDFNQKFNQEKTEVSSALQGLVNTDNASSEWSNRMTHLSLAIRQHVKEQETSLFPKMSRIFKPTELDELGAKAIEVKNGLHEAIAVFEDEGGLILV